MEIFEPLIRSIRASATLEEYYLPVFKQSFKVRKLRKREFLLQPGKVSDCLYFVSSGCVRSYFLEDEKEIVTKFGIEGWCISDLNSFLTQEPASHFIQAIENSVILELHRSKLEKLYVDIPSMERFFRIKFQNAYKELFEHHRQSIILSAKERYDLFISRYSNIEQRVPQYMIASYLGISKEFLSHVRKLR